MRHLLALATIAVVAACVPTGAQAPAGTLSTAPPEVSCREFAAALQSCAPAACLQPHPLARGFVIRHEISGEDGGFCRYSQSMPEDMNMTCGLSPAGRAMMSEQISATLQGTFSMSPDEQRLMARECEVRNAKGETFTWMIPD